MKRHRFLPALLSAGLLSAAMAPPPAHAQAVLTADFQDQPVDQPIGLGGAAAGQPVSVATRLDAIVRDTPMPTRSLELGWNDASVSAAYARFHLLDGSEVVDGQVLIEFDLLPQTASIFLVNIRESSSSARDYGSLRLQGSGNLLIGDGAGSVVVAGGWSVGAVLSPWFLYDLDARTWSFGVGADTVFVDRPVGPPVDGRGIGAVNFGLDFNTPADTRLSIDNLRVTRIPADALFADGFEE